MEFAILLKSLIAVVHDLSGQKDGTWQAKVMMRMAWFEAIMQIAARQIPISNEINTWKYFITWFAGKGI